MGYKTDHLGFYPDPVKSPINKQRDKIHKIILKKTARKLSVRATLKGIHFSN